MSYRYPSVKGCITTKRFFIPYRVYGNSGPSIVCLNGVHQSMAMWHSFIQRFAADYKIVVFDFPGQGKGKTFSGEVTTSIDEQVNIFKKVMEVTDVEDVTICSASWGGVVALAFAQKYPQLINRMLLGGMATRPNQSMIETIEKGCRIDICDRQKMAEVLIGSFGENLPEQMKNRIIRQFETMNLEQLQSFCEQGLFVLAQRDLGEIVDLQNISTETILFRAENDTITDLEDVKFLREQIPNCRLKIVKNVGHFLHLESDDVLEDYHKFLPRKFNANKSSIIDFLQLGQDQFVEHF